MLPILNCPEGIETQLCAEDFASKTRKALERLKSAVGRTVSVLYYKQHSWKTSNLFTGRFSFQVSRKMKRNLFLCKITVSKIKNQLALNATIRDTRGGDNTKR